MNEFIADAEHPWIVPTAEADEDRADSRPPHPVDGQFEKSVFEEIDQAGEQGRAEAGDDADDHGDQQRIGAERRVIHHGKDRAGAEQRHAEHRGDQGGGGDRNETAGPPLEEEQFHSKEGRGDGRREDRGHARGRAGHEQRLALGGGEVKQLRHDGPKRAAGHDDRSFRAEGAARADGNRGGNRLQNRHFRLDETTPQEDRLESFRDAVSADFFRSVAGHQSNDQRTHDGRGDDPGAQVVMRERRKDRIVALEEDKIGDDGDEPEQRLGDYGTEGADGQGEGDE